MIDDYTYLFNLLDTVNKTTNEILTQASLLQPIQQ